MDMDARYSRIVDGACHKVPPSEWLAWQSLTGHVVYSWEFAILAAMDHAYCAAVNEEIRIGRVMEEQARGK